MTAPKTLAEVRAQFRGSSRNEIDSAILVAWKCALNSVTARDPADLSGLGCGDNSCVIQRPSGMGTNGGCCCDERTLRRAVMILRAELDLVKARAEYR